MAKLPYFPFYPGDWLKDPELMVCSHFARALLVDLLCAAHEAKRRGVLARPDGVTPWTDEQLVGLSPGGSTDEKLAALRELEANHVLKRDGNGCLYSARMVRDDEIREKRAAAGSKGGSKRSSKLQANGQANAKQNTEYENEDENEDESVSDQGGMGGSVEKPKRIVFVIPSASEVADYCRERSNGIDAEHFCDFYTARNWVMTNGKKMADWRAAVRTWEKNAHQRSNGKAKHVEGANDPDYIPF